MPCSAIIWEALSCSLWEQTNLQRQNWAVCREWETWSTRPKIGCLHEIPILTAQGILQKRMQEDCKSQRGWKIARKQVPLDTTRLAHIWIHTDCGSMQGAYTSVSQKGYQHWGAKWTEAPISNRKSVSNWSPLNRKNLSEYTKHT